MFLKGYFGILVMKSFINFPTMKEVEVVTVDFFNVLMLVSNILQTARRDIMVATSSSDSGK